MTTPRLRISVGLLVAYHTPPTHTRFSARRKPLSVSRHAETRYETQSHRL